MKTSVPFRLVTGVIGLGLFLGCERSVSPPAPNPPATTSSATENAGLIADAETESTANDSAEKATNSEALVRTEDFGGRPEFMVMAYNVENLFDIDGQALFDDYQSSRYGAPQLLKKLRGITEVLKQFQEGKGPEIVLFQELEHDLTPAAGPIDYVQLLKPFQDVTVEKMLTGEISAAVRDLPVEAFLLKSLHGAGLGPYHVVVAEFRDDPTERTVAHVNATFSRFAVGEHNTHQSDGARGTLEVVHQIGGSPLHTFNVHWKSGASDQKSEQIRIGNADVVRRRLDEILKSDPAADVVLGGDFNSLYNQSQRFSNWKESAVNDILGSQGDELAVRQSGGPDLYNLWYELPPEERRSDAYRGSWGTLIQLMITRGLYDYRGIQYVDNSQSVARIEGLNAQHGSGLPIRWNSINGEGAGYSDHFPVLARFRVVGDNDANRLVELERPGKPGGSAAELQGIAVDYAAIPRDRLLSTEELGSTEEIRKTENMGRLFNVKSVVSGEKPFKIKVQGDEYTVWAFDLDLRLKIYERFPVGAEMNFLGELGVHEGTWQFVVQDISWLDPR